MTEIVFWASVGLLGYVLIGYPVLLLLISKFCKQLDFQPVDRLPNVTLVVPAHNEIAVIREKLANLKAIDYPGDKLEILVGSDGSTDGTNEVVQSEENDQLRLLAFENRRGKASVVNDCVSQAKNEVICLCDANVMFAGDALKQLVTPLCDPTIGAVTGMVVLRSEESNFGSGETTYYSFERQIQIAECQVGSLIGVDGGMYVIRKSLFQPLPADTILDDFVVTMRVIRQKGKVIYQPSAVATENGTPEAKQEWRRRVRVAAGSVQSLFRGEFPRLTQPVVFWQYLSHKLLRWLAPVYLLSALASNVLLLTDAWFYRVFMLGQVAIYALALIATFSIAVRRTRLGGIPFYFLMSNAAMLLGYIKGCLKLQPVTWVQADRSVESAEATATD